MTLRIPLTGSTSAPSTAPGCRISPARAMPARPLPLPGGSRPSSEARARAVAERRGCPERKASTSRSMTRPSGPVPARVSGSIPCLRASLRARGLIPAPAGVGEEETVGISAVGSTEGAEIVSSIWDGVGSPTGVETAPEGRNSSAPSPSSPTAATLASTGTSSSGSQKSSRTVPEAVDSKSKLALSVSITAKTSPSETTSPTCTFHSVRIQLSTDCPWRGMMIGVAMNTSLLLVHASRTFSPRLRNVFAKRPGRLSSLMSASTLSQPETRAKETFPAFPESASRMTRPACSATSAFT